MGRKRKAAAVDAEGADGKQERVEDAKDAAAEPARGEVKEKERKKERGPRKRRRKAKAAAAAAAEAGDDAAAGAAEADGKGDAKESAGGGEEQAPLSSEAERTVFVEGFPYDTTEDALRVFFHDCGEIHDVRMPVYGRARARAAAGARP